MVAHDMRSGRDPGRRLSVAVTDAVRCALVRRLREVEDDDELGRALADAAAEARGRALLPEELIIAMKEIEAEVAATAGLEKAAVRPRLRAWMVTTCIEAYFGGASS